MFLVKVSKAVGLLEETRKTWRRRTTGEWEDGDDHDIAEAFRWELHSRHLLLLLLLTCWKQTKLPGPIFTHKYY